MQTDVFIKKLKEELNKELPGEEYQERMASPYRNRYKAASREPQNGSVMVLLYPLGGKVHTVLIVRTLDTTVHSGQISLPGGGIEESDESPQDAALRELTEEVHVEREDVQILGSLTTLYIPASNYYVQPFVGYIDYKPVFIANPQEVQEIIEAPIDHLASPENISTIVIKYKDSVIEAPCYAVGNYKVWGATAMILNEFLEVARRTAFFI